MDLEIELETGEEESLQWSKHMAIGKIYATKILNRKGVMAILRSIWVEEVAPSIREVGENTYGISFKSERARDRAIGDGPWSIMGSCMNLKKWVSDRSVAEIDFSELDVWLQIHDLPPDMLTYKNAKAIGKVLGMITNEENKLEDEDAGVGR
ncbi:hypothetical protein CCACVL1_30061 [Corchorus capsularis]|uniref:DUF4283 domain-containing protein n=1 Tax=Corchorus capsularis TaxID=210143 RepID=A0A1R3FYX0_COCAP|nr:hypothetical protein CCACVL1_30061 [Corchorus capsularis]